MEPGGRLLMQSGVVRVGFLEESMCCDLKEGRCSGSGSGVGEKGILSERPLLLQEF